MKNEPRVSLHILHYPTLPSTNAQLNTLLAEDDSMAEFTVVSTDVQSAGRGQGSNVWDSAPHQNLTFSILLYPELPAMEHFYLNMCISLGIKKTLDTYMDGVLIKWPNDIYHHDDKICGILIESSIMSGKIIRSVVGIGLNVAQCEWASWVPNPTSILRACGKNPDKDELLQQIAEDIHHYYQMLKNGDKDTLYALYTEVMYRRNMEAEYSDAQGQYKGVIMGVDEIGRMKVKNTATSQVMHYHFKEVKYL